jgi:hypothetical protein
MYAQNPTALHLRAMNMLYEGMKDKGSMIIVPSSALETMNLGVANFAMNAAQNMPHGVPQPAPQAAPAPRPSPVETGMAPPPSTGGFGIPGGLDI